MSEGRVTLPSEQERLRGISMRTQRARDASQRTLTRLEKNSGTPRWLIDHIRFTHAALREASIEMARISWEAVGE